MEFLKSRSGKKFLTYLLHLFFSIFIAIFTFLFCKTPLGEIIELRSQDFRFKVRGETKPEEEILIIKIDEKTFDELKIKYPFPPIYYAELVKKLTEAGASIIAFDLLYSEPSRECNPPNQDLILAEEMKKANNVIWAIQLDEKDKPKFPIEVIKNSTLGLGYINLPEERDGIIRKVCLSRGSTNSFAAEIIKNYAGFLSEKFKTEKPMLINFRGGENTYSSISFSDVIKSEIDTSKFRGKICLVGATFVASHDLYPTVFHEASKANVPGIEIHANIIGNILRGNFFRELPLKNILIFIFVSVILMETIIYFGNPLIGIILWIFFIILWIFFSFFYFFKGISTPFIIPVFMISSSFWGGIFLKYLEERKRKKEIQNLFSSYVDSDVVKWLLKNPEAVNFEGVKKKVTILYTDIESFTSITEKMEPNLLVKHLNYYFENLTRIGMARGGMIDKFIGDAIMMVFGFPKEDGKHSLNALFAAKEMLEFLEKMNNEWNEKNLPLLKTRIGIATGGVLIGNIGGEKRKSFTAIGDAVNLASRLEEANKFYGTSVLISEETAKEVSQYFQFKEIKEVQLKGFSKLLKIYNPIFDFQKIQAV